MLTEKEKKTCRMLLSGYKSKLHKFVLDCTGLPTDGVVREYEDRFYRYTDEADMGSGRGRFTSYLNIFSGLAAYEILRENGLSEAEGIKAYDQMCASMLRTAGSLSSSLYIGTNSAMPSVSPCSHTKRKSGRSSASA